MTHIFACSDTAAVPDLDPYRSYDVAANTETFVTCRGGYRRNINVYISLYLYI